MENCNIKLLDCTLRDGGYINDWRFGFNNIKEIISSLVRSNVDVVEVGFLRNVGYDKDVTRWSTIEELKKVLPLKTGNTLFSAMALHNFYNLDNLKDYDGTDIDIIRVTFHDYDIEEGMLFCQKVKSKGYKVSCNPINIMGYSDNQILDIIERVNLIQPWAFSIVDTFGSMNFEDLERIIGIVNHNLNKDVRLGLHLHENMAQSFSMAQSFLTKHINREVIIDGSLMGMGRVPGNLSIELMAHHLNAYYNKNYDIDYMLDAIEDHIMVIKEKYGWGYTPAYFLSAKYNLHRNYAEYFLEKGNLTHKDINHLLSRISHEKKTAFDSHYADELYRDYLSCHIDDTDDVNQLRDLFKDKNILILAPGSTLNSYKDKIIEYINQNHPLILALNFVPEFSQIKAEYAFFTNNKRYDKLVANNCKLIVSSNLSDGPADYRVDYNCIAGAFEQGSNSLILVLRLLKRIGVKEACIAGADGYKAETDNYYDMSMRNHKKRDDNYNFIMATAIRTQEVKVNFITPSMYEPEGEK